MCDAIDRSLYLFSTDTTASPDDMAVVIMTGRLNCGQVVETLPRDILCVYTPLCATARGCATGSQQGNGHILLVSAVTDAMPDKHSSCLFTGIIKSSEPPKTLIGYVFGVALLSCGLWFGCGFIPSLFHSWGGLFYLAFFWRETPTMSFSPV